MTTEERLEVLEKEVKRVRRHNRWLLGIILFVGTGLSVISLLGMRTAQVPDEIRARRFIVEDENGIKRAELSLSESEDSVWLSLFGRYGAIHLSVSDDPESGVGLELIGPGLSASLLVGEREGQLYIGSTYGDPVSHPSAILWVHEGAARLFLDDERGHVTCVPPFYVPPRRKSGH